MPARGPKAESREKQAERSSALASYLPRVSPGFEAAAYEAPRRLSSVYAMLFMHLLSMLLCCLRNNSLDTDPSPVYAVYAISSLDTG